MSPEVVEIIRGVFFWMMLVGVVGGYIFLRIANRNRDKAAFIEFPESPDKFLLRARIAYAVFIVFLLTTIGGLAIVVFQILQIYRPSISRAVQQPTVTVVNATDTPEASSTPTLFVRTATPAPTRTPTPAQTSVPDVQYLARVGNTNFEGVNLRAGPGLNFDIVARLSPGTALEVLDNPSEAADGYTWLHVRIDEITDGWIAADFVIPVETVEE